MLSQRQTDALADAIGERYRHFDNGGAVQFGIEEAVLAVAEMFAAWSVEFDATAFKSRCFSGEVRA